MPHESERFEVIYRALIDIWNLHEADVVRNEIENGERKRAEL